MTNCTRLCKAKQPEFAKRGARIASGLQSPRLLLRRVAPVWRIQSSMEFEAVIVGSGPNGLAAAIEIARAGHSVCVLEARETIGGGTRTAELTLPGFLHDVCSAVHPLAIASPFFKTLPLASYGLEWIHSPASVAHPFDDGSASILYRSVRETSATLGDDAPAYDALFSSLARNAEKLVPEILAPPVHLPRHPLLLTHFGVNAIQSAQGWADRHFRGSRARSLFTGMAGHSNMPLNGSLTAAFGLLLGMLGHAEGWPIIKGGSQKLSDALASYLTSLGGRIVTGSHVKSWRDVPAARAVLFDLTPRQVLNLTSEQLPSSYQWELRRYRYGPGAFKVDWALSSPIPWKARECSEAATIHVGGTAEEITESEQIVGRGQCPERPFVLLAQPTLFDFSRAPAGKHTAWAYCHVPNNSSIDMTDRIESQIERFAPGFRDCILGRHTMSAPDFETYNPNYIGGDISGGLQSVLQVLGRPSLRVTPYAMPAKGLFICSSSTPPGGGVHGMCGYHAARAALASVLYNRMP
jgi:phytoene dehydrogenase-like protein